LRLPCQTADLVPAAHLLHPLRSPLERRSSRANYQGWLTIAYQAPGGIFASARNAKKASVIF
jgi:hypothetical protein